MHSLLGRMRVFQSVLLLLFYNCEFIAVSLLLILFNYSQSQAFNYRDDKDGYD